MLYFLFVTNLSLHDALPIWFSDSLFIVHRIFLRYDMQYFITRRQYQFVHVIDQFVNVFFTDFIMRIVTGQNSMMAKAFYMLTCNHHMDYFDLTIDLALYDLDRFPDRGYGFLNIRNHTPSLPVTLDFSNRSEEHTSELQSRGHLVCRLLLEK